MAATSRTAVIAVPVCVHSTDDHDAGERADELLERIQRLVDDMGDAHVLAPREAAKALRDLAEGWDIAAEAIEAAAARRAQLQ